MPDIENLELYREAMQLSSDTWNLVRFWTYFHKDTLGKQIVQAADSIPCNIAEGYGRFTYKERIRFCHIARGSLYEYKTQLRIGQVRGLVDDNSHESLGRRTDSLGRLLNGFIRHLRQQQESRSRGHGETSDEEYTPAG